MSRVSRLRVLSGTGLVLFVLSLAGAPAEARNGHGITSAGRPQAASNRSIRGGNRGRHAIEYTNNGVIYDNPEYYLFDSLYGNNSYNSYNSYGYSYDFDYDINFSWNRYDKFKYKPSYYYYPNFNWYRYKPWYPNYSNALSLLSSYSVGWGYPSSWYPGWLWF